MHEKVFGHLGIYPDTAEYALRNLSLEGLGGMAWRLRRAFRDLFLGVYQHRQHTAGVTRAGLWSQGPEYAPEGCDLGLERSEPFLLGAAEGTPGEVVSWEPGFLRPVFSFSPRYPAAKGWNAQFYALQEHYVWQAEGWPTDR